MRSKGFLAFAILLLAPSVHAEGILDVNLIDPSNLNGIVPQNLANAAIKMFGIYTAHRPYTGATSISHSNSLDIMVEGTLVKLGPGVTDALAEDGLSGATIGVPAVPIGKLQIRKGFGNYCDLGLSGLFYRGQTIVGGDLKIVLHDAEEGPSYAIRLGYTYTNVPYAYVQHLSTISPEFVVSQRMTFAEPYIGIGGRWMKGMISIPFEGTPPAIPDFTVEKVGTAITGYAFTGVFFRIFDAPGIRVGVDGTFDLSGYHTMGAAFGFGF